MDPDPRGGDHDNRPLNGDASDDDRPAADEGSPPVFGFW